MVPSNSENAADAIAVESISQRARGSSVQGSFPYKKMGITTTFKIFESRADKRVPPDIGQSLSTQDSLHRISVEQVEFSIL